MRQKILIFFAIFVIFSCQQLLAQDTNKTAEEETNGIHGLVDQLEKKEKFVDHLTESDLANLPVGILKNKGGIRYIIAIDKMHFHQGNAYFNAYMSLKIPNSERRIAFKAENIPLHKGGLAASVESAKLILVTEQRISVSKNVELILPAVGGRNFVEWDCNGFKGMNLKGVFEFDSTLVTSVQPDGTPTNQKVQATFETYIEGWRSFQAGVSISPFQVKRLKGFTFEVQDAWVDFSDTSNPANMVFPEGYAQLFNADINLWEGFFLRRATVTLPKELARNDSKPIQISAENMLIDDMGVSGAFSVSNILPLKDGNISGWAFSIDQLSIALQCNKIKGGGLKGQLNIPFFDEEEPLDYEALIMYEDPHTNYYFTISPGSNLKASVLAADVVLFPNSTITIARVNGKLKPEARLHGELTINTSIGPKEETPSNDDTETKVKLAGLRFENLHMSTEKPYIHEGYWSLTGSEEQKVAKFPIQLKNVSFQHTEQYMALNVDAVLSLMNDSAKGFGASATVTVRGKIEEEILANEQRKQRWKYDGTSISTIKINAQAKVFSLKGSLTLYQKDPVFGNGFRGDIEATFLEKIVVNAEAQFGNVNGLRYWYVDANTLFAEGIPIAGGMGMYGFGGGLYYHMSRSDAQKFIAANNGGQPIDLDKPGGTQSGVSYIPDKNTSLGFKASVVIGTHPKPKPFNADATFEIAFNSTGGLKYIGFMGDGYFMCDIKERSKNVPVRASLNVLYDHANKIFHANLETYINVKNVLVGTGHNYLAGQAVLHFSPDKWYIHVGTPQQRLGVTFKGLAQANAYLVMGTEIPDMPPPPQNVSSILGDIDLDMMRDENALATGGGFAFGAGISMNTGRMRFAVFYAQFQAGLGFDIMLRDYGNAQCAGRPGPIGVNGWYASGQAWGYIQGTVGIEVKLKFIKGNFDILDIGAAVVLQAKLPNPAWMQGVVGGYYSILGGLIKGKCRFKMTIGEECEIQGGSAVDGFNVIADMSPKNNDSDVDVFAAPQVAFNIAINKSLDLKDVDGKIKGYRAVLDHFKVKGSHGDIVGELEWNDNHDVLILNPFEILPPEAKLTADVRIHWEERQNGQWKPLKFDGKVAQEEKNISFKTGKAPDHIPDHNVAYSYPMAKQYNFLKNEEKKAYLAMKQWQYNLFEPLNDGREWKFIARYELLGQDGGVQVPLTYEKQNKSLYFEVPGGLINEKIYNLKLVRYPVDPNQKVDENVQRVTTSVADTEGGTVETEQKIIEKTLELAEEKILYEMHFRTSRFNSLEEKLTALTHVFDYGYIIPGYQLLQLQHTREGEEVFDEYEIGKNDREGLIQMEALSDATPWLTDNIEPLVYNDYPFNNNILIKWRDEAVLGAPPFRAIKLKQSVDAPYLEDAHINSNFAPTPNGRSTFMYDLSYNAFRDFSELRNKCFSIYVDAGYNNLPIGATKLMNEAYKSIFIGTYKFKISYRLPGSGKVTSFKVLEVKY